MTAHSRKAKPLPDISILEKMFSYDPITGAMTWRKRDLSFFTSNAESVQYGINIFNASHAGKPAGTRRADGYKILSVLESKYLLHRIAWKLETRKDPVGAIDHINHDPSDNRIINLRDTGLDSEPSNQKNLSLRSDNTSSFSGVSWHKGASKWRARIKIKGKEKYLGSFDSIEEAISARLAANKSNNFHPNHGQ